MTGPVTVRDLRDLPFFQVRLPAVEAIRAAAPERSRARTIGFYAICCQLANEQRHAGEQRRFVTSYDELAARARIARKTVQAMLATLDQAGAIRIELTPDLDRGTIVTTLHLPIQDGPFAAITVAMANHLATNHGRVILTTGRGDLGGYLTRDLGIIVTLLQFCIKQYSENGGGCALLERADFARLAGLSIDSIDNCIKILEELGLLAVERRRGANGGRFRPSVYSLLEPGQTLMRVEAPNAEPGNQQGGDSTAATRNVETRNAESRNQQGGGSINPRRSRETGKAEAEAIQGGVSVLPPPEARPSTAQTRSDLKGIEELSPPLSSRALTESRTASAAPGGEGELEDQEETRLCRELVAVLSETRGPAPGRRYNADRHSWHAAAGRVLVDHPIDKVLDAIAYLPRDQIIGTKVRSMPDLERHIEDLRHRTHAAKALTPTARSAVTPSDLPAWPEAKAALLRAIKRHGAGAKATALAELEARDPQLVRFTELIGWGELCQSPFEKQDYAYRTSWDDLTRRAATEEAA